MMFGEHIEISNKIIAPPLDEIKAHLTMPNPKYREAVKMGRWAKGIDPLLKFYRETDQGLECPRGVARWIAQNFPGKIIDQRRTLPPVDLTFHGELRDFQQPAVEQCLQRDFGILNAATGSGKTCMALYMIAARQQPALILVHTKDLLHQWRDRIGQFLKIEAGIIGDGKFNLAPVTVATAQSAAKHNLAEHFGYLVVDECHRAPAMQFVKVVEQFDCRYMTGLSATPYRRDGLSKVICWHIGDVVATIDKAALVDNGDLCRAKVEWTETNFYTPTDASAKYSRALSELAADETRNALIAAKVSRDTGPALILSDRKAHCETLAAMLADHGIKAEILTGSTKDRERIVEDMQQGRCKHLVATGSLIGEGFDLPAISSLYLATPVKYHGRLVQYVGRVLRPAPGKEQARIYDFADNKMGVFAASARSRAETYAQQGIA